MCLVNVTVTVFLFLVFPFVFHLNFLEKDLTLIYFGLLLLLHHKNLQFLLERVDFFIFTIYCSCSLP